MGKLLALTDATPAGSRASNGRTRSRPLILAIGASLALTGRAALAQSPINLSHKFSWQENCGWMNWAGGVGGGGPTVLVAPTYLSGQVWCENIGWVFLGATPPDGYHYGNTGGSDYGVNRDAPAGHLSGFAWSENAGWINFAGGALASPPSPARYDAGALRLRGYAWGENIGWINLDHAVHYVAVACDADCDGDGAIVPADVACFVNKWFASLSSGSLDGDFDHNGIIQPADVAVFINAWFAALGGGC